MSRRHHGYPGQRFARPMLLGLALAIGVASLTIAHHVRDDATGRTSALVLVGIAIGATGTALIGLLSWAGSQTTRVFRSRPLFALTTVTVVLASSTIAHLAVSSPFRELFATGRFHPADIADIGCLLVAVVALVAAVVVGGEASTAARTERRWPVALEASPTPNRGDARA